MRENQFKDIVELIVLLIFKIQADLNKALIVILFLRAGIGRGILSHDGVELLGVIGSIRLIDRAHKTVLDPVVGLFPCFADLRCNIAIPKLSRRRRTRQVCNQRERRKGIGAGGFALHQRHDLVNFHIVEIKVEPRLERIVAHAVLQRLLDIGNRQLIVRFGIHDRCLVPGAAGGVDVAARRVKKHRGGIIGPARLDVGDIRRPRKNVIARADVECHIGRGTVELEVAQKVRDIRQTRVAGRRQTVIALHIGDCLIHGLRKGLGIVVAIHLHKVVEGLRRLHPAGMVAVDLNLPDRAGINCRHVGGVRLRSVRQIPAVLEVIIHVGDRVEHLSRLRRGVCTEYGETDRDARHDHDDGQQAT